MPNLKEHELHVVLRQKGVPRGLLRRQGMLEVDDLDEICRQDDLRVGQMHHDSRHEEHGQ